MASLRRRGEGTSYHLIFSYGGEKFERSLSTKHKHKATRLKSIVEETLEHLRRGILSLPDGCTADKLWSFVLSGGKTDSTTPKLTQSKRLESLVEEYLSSYVDGAKEAATLKTERVHLNNFQRILGSQILIHQITPAVLEEYMRTRLQEDGNHGKTIKPTTVSKEVQTFSQLWNFASNRDYVRGANPCQKVRKPRRDQLPPFMTWEEIEKRIQRGGVAPDEAAELWKCLFLRESEIGDFLAHVRESSKQFRWCPYIYPALCFLAYTGSRRSEMFRCEVDDVSDRIVIREKKKSQQRRITLRDVPLHPKLGEVLDEWLSNHPGGTHLFCKNKGTPLEDKTSRDALAAVVRRSKWNVIHGFHVLRHSFASNLARRGERQDVIDKLMGHQTEEMRMRYRHLFPEERQSAILSLDFG